MPLPEPSRLPELSPLEHALLEFYWQQFGAKVPPPFWASAPDGGWRAYHLAASLHGRELTAIHGSGVYDDPPTAMFYCQLLSGVSPWRLHPHAQQWILNRVHADFPRRVFDIESVAGLDCVVSEDRVVAVPTNPGLSGFLGSVEPHMADLVREIARHLRD